MSSSGLATAVKLRAAVSQDTAIFSINEPVVYVLRHTYVPPKLSKSDSTKLKNLTQDTDLKFYYTRNSVKPRDLNKAI
jgi:hypothetical protein